MTTPQYLVPPTPSGRDSSSTETVTATVNANKYSARIGQAALVASADVAAMVVLGWKSPSPVQYHVNIVSALPSAASVGPGVTAFVTDSTVAYASAAIGTTVVGGGANFNRLYSDGVTWKIG